MVIIYIICKNKKEAEKIGRSLLKKRFAACCNIFPLDSVYWWHGKIVEDKETALIVKTLEENFKKIEKEVKRLHSYQTPCISEILVSQANKDYLDWLKKEIKQRA